MTAHKHIDRTFTAEEKHREALREVEMRRQVYGRRAPGGVMPDRFQRQIELMQAIADDYAKAAEKERLI